MSAITSANLANAIVKLASFFNWLKFVDNGPNLLNYHRMEI